MVKAITFDLEGGDLKVPVVGQYELNLPPYFATMTKKGWKLLNPITTIRNLAKRNKNLVLDLNRNPSSLEPEIGEEQGVEMPSIGDFNLADQKKLRRWEANQHKEGIFPITDKPVKPRGRPAFLPKNAKLQGLKYKKGTTHYGDNLKKTPESDSESEEEEKRPKGRPKSAKTLEKERRKEEEEEKERRRKEEEEEEKEEEEKRRKAEKESEKETLQIAEDFVKKEGLWEKAKKKLEKDLKNTYGLELVGSSEKERRINKIKDLLKTLEKSKSEGKPFWEWDKTRWKNYVFELSPPNKTQLYNLGRGLKTKDQVLKDEYESNDEDDGMGGGSIFSGLLSKVKSLVINPIVNKVEDIGNKVIHGRMDYPPSAKAIIDKYGDQQVQSISLHRLILPSLYTNILSVWTKGETEKKLKEEPKDKLFHISMWVKLPNALILCEKNEVIHLQINPKKAKKEEEQDAPTPSNTTFRELLEKGKASVGDDKFFSYSAKSNNCGNWIEYILRANGIENQGTKDFIGQDTNKILEGFPTLRKTLNTLTDIAGRANVVMEGGELPDWEHLNWGSFTKQFERYNQEYPDNEIKDLEHFAESILANPTEYKPKTLKRAKFYLNVILKKKSHYNNIMPSHRLNGGAVLGLPKSNAIMRPIDPRTRSPMPIHSLHPNAMDTVYHDPNAVPHEGSGIHHHHHHYHLGGMGVFDKLGRAFDPRQNGIAKAFSPNGSAEQLGKQVASTLIHTGLPLAGQVAGSTLGRSGGNALGNLIGKETGYGLKSKRFAKGSAEAKAFMASIRRKKGGRGLYGGEIPAPHSRSYITDPSML